MRGRPSCVFIFLCLLMEKSASSRLELYMMIRKSRLPLVTPIFFSSIEHFFQNDNGIMLL
ncbi:hypothetical protein HALA3H3_560006 [Halomonas sp. A3H3]|nr:hypothetical protein HALA3H3_560006 [Halomonas sp. A3H3]